jgi:CheY-like chemotaxis protein
MAKILIVEDDQLLSNAYRLKFSKVGHDVKMASDGELALQVLKDFKPDVIILDLIMPGKDGFTTLTEIKADPNLSDIPVVIASNLGQEEDIKKCMSAGAAGFFVKSNVSLEDLITNVLGYIKS